MDSSALFTLLVAGVIAIAAWSRVAEPLRVASLSRAAVALGMRFTQHLGYAVQREVSDAPFAQALGGAVGRNLISDGELSLLEVSTRGGQRVVVAFTDAPDVARFRVEARRPGVPGRTSSVESGVDELYLDAPPEFSDRYRVFGEPSQRARWSPALLALLLAHPGWNLEAHRGRVYAWNTARDHLSPRSLAAQVDAHRSMLREVTRALAAPPDDPAPT